MNNKVRLFIIGIVLANFSHSFAQTSLEMSQKKDNASLRGLLELPKGFTYVDREAAADDKKLSSSVLEWRILLGTTLGQLNFQLKQAK